MAIQALPPSTQYLRVPNNNTKMLIEQGTAQQTWYRFFSGLVSGTPPAQTLQLDVTASPYVWRATNFGYVVANGGTITSVTLQRDPAQTPINLPLTGTYHASKDDILTFTYSALPVLTFIPQ